MYHTIYLTHSHSNVVGKGLILGKTCAMMSCSSDEQYHEGFDTPSHSPRLEHSWLTRTILKLTSCGTVQSSPLTTQTTQYTTCMYNIQFTCTCICTCTCSIVLLNATLYACTYTCTVLVYMYPHVNISTIVLHVTVLKILVLKHK